MRSSPDSRQGPALRTPTLARTSTQNEIRSQITFRYRDRASVQRYVEDRERSRRTYINPLDADSLIALLLVRVLGPARARQVAALIDREVS